MGRASNRKKLKLDPPSGQSKPIVLVSINPAKRVDETKYQIISERIVSPEEAAKMPEVLKTLKFTGASRKDIATAFKKTCDDVGNTEHKIRVYECVPRSDS